MATRNIEIDDNKIVLYIGDYGISIGTIEADQRDNPRKPHVLPDLLAFHQYCVGAQIGKCAYSAEGTKANQKQIRDYTRVLSVINRLLAEIEDANKSEITPPSADQTDQSTV